MGEAVSGEGCGDRVWMQSSATAEREAARLPSAEPPHEGVPTARGGMSRQGLCCAWMGRMWPEGSAV